MPRPQAGDAATKQIPDIQALLNEAATRVAANSQIVTNAPPDPLARQRDCIGRFIIAVFALALLAGFAGLLR
jgi:hypothetical protein